MGFTSETSKSQSHARLASWLNQLSKDARVALGIAVFPMLCLGAAGYKDNVLFPVLFCSWLTAYLGILMGPANAKD